MPLWIATLKVSTVTNTETVPNCDKQKNGYTEG